MSTTRAKITEAIKRRTGHDVEVAGSAAIGCYHFASDDPETADMLARIYSSTVYVCYLSDLTPGGWADEYQQLTGAPTV